MFDISHTGRTVAQELQLHKRRAKYPCAKRLHRCVNGPWTGERLAVVVGDQATGWFTLHGVTGRYIVVGRNLSWVVDTKPVCDDKSVF